MYQPGENKVCNLSVTRGCARCIVFGQSLHENVSLKQTAFVTVNDGFVNLGIQAIRTIEFWRRVLTIWASFKVTQTSIGVQGLIQIGNKAEDWQRSKWDRQHRRAANVREVIILLPKNNGGKHSINSVQVSDVSDVLCR